MPVPLLRPAGDASSALSFFAITPSDVTNFTNAVAGIYVGVAGDVVAINESGAAITFKNAGQGATIAIKAQRVNATGTTATNLVGLY